MKGKTIRARLHKGDPAVTFGEKYEPAMKMESAAAAAHYFELCVEHTMIVRPTDDRALAESIERQNLGYYASYYDHATRERVERLFSCEHPIFGPTSNNVTPERAMRLGAMLAKAT